jgi:copper chaperone CopZ
MLAAGALALTAVLGGRPVYAAERTVSFRVTSACNCAECAFSARRDIPRIQGVKEARLSVKDRRLDVTFDDSRKPVSTLAQAIGRTDLGKGCTLVWAVVPGADPQRLASALANVPGVASTKVDGKAKAVLVAFAPKPEVSLSQLDAAGKGETVAHP